jgi:hypothetical protein
VDRDSDPLPGVSVTLTRAGRQSGSTCLTGPQGRVRFWKVKPGDYVIRFELSGFAAASIGPVTVTESTAENPRLPEFLVLLNPVMVD